MDNELENVEDIDGKKKPSLEDTRCRSWCATLWGYEDKQAEVEAALASYTYAGQLEVAPTTGALHWQLYIENATQIKAGTLMRALPGIHLEKRRGTKAEALAYVRKADTYAGVRIGNCEIDVSESSQSDKFIESLHYEIVHNGKSADAILDSTPAASRHHSALYAVEAAHKRLRYARWEFDDRPMTVFYVEGARGLGKSTWSADVLDALGCEGKPRRFGSYHWCFDAYDYEDAVYFDEFRSPPELDISLMNSVLEGLPCDLPRRGKRSFAAFTKAVVASNWPIGWQYRDAPEVDREAFLSRFDAVYKMTGVGQVELLDTPKSRLRRVPLVLAPDLPPFEVRHPERVVNDCESLFDLVCA